MPKFKQNPANVVACDRPMGMIARLGSQEADEEVAVYETISDFGSELSECYYGLHEAWCRSILLLMGNESLQETISSHRPNLLDCHSN